MEAGSKLPPIPGLVEQRTGAAGCGVDASRPRDPLRGCFRPGDSVIQPQELGSVDGPSGSRSARAGMSTGVTEESYVCCDDGGLLRA